MKIADREIGYDSPVFIIAEIGSNHNGDLATAFDLIDLAKEAGCDAAKFQVWKAERLYDNPEWYAKYQLPREWIPQLADYCKKEDIIFFASAFDPEAISALDPYVPCFKWATCNLPEFEMLKYCVSKGKPMIISMPDIFNISKLSKIVKHDQTAYMYCVPEYPPELRDIDLNIMEDMIEAFSGPVGFSDHTLGTIASLVAVSRGACLIEKHITFSRKQEGPDHPFALEPDELKSLVREIRNIEEILS